jgi:hypothetical protein
MTDSEGIHDTRESGPDAMARVVQAVQRLRGDVVNLRIRIGEHACGVVAQANADVAGRAVRVQVAAAGFSQAVDGVRARMLARVLEASENWSPRPWQRDEEAGPLFPIPRRYPPLAPDSPVARIK